MPEPPDTCRKLTGREPPRPIRVEPRVACWEEMPVCSPRGSVRG